MPVASRRGSGRLQRAQTTTQEPTTIVDDAGVKASSLSMMLTNISIHPLKPADGGYLTALIEDFTNIRPLLESPAAFGLTDDIFDSARLTNASVKPLTPSLWLLTATISRAADPTRSPRDLNIDIEMVSSSGDGDQSSGTACSIHHCTSEIETDVVTSQTRRSRWSEEEDDKLRCMKENGDPWSDICEGFPSRTEGAVKQHWYTVLAPNNGIAV